jgi:hypothetical protein
VPPSTIDGLSHLDGADSAPARRRRLLLYRVTMGVVAGLVVLAVVDGLDLYDTVGVDAGTVRVSGDDLSVVVEYPKVTRPALASPFRVRVERPGGFTSPIIVAVSRPWIEIWDENGLYPTPSAETADEDWVEWEFDPPDGPTFEFFYDARLEPARQSPQFGQVEVRDTEGGVLAAVEFTTTVRP